MQETVESIILQSKKVTIDIAKIEAHLKASQSEKRTPLFYKELANTMLALEEKGLVLPVKSSGRYYMDTRIFNRYKKISTQEKDYQEYKDEILTNYHPNMLMSFYLKNVNHYKKDREILKRISQFLIEKKKGEPRISVNERSYQLFGNEKLLFDNRGKKIMSNVGLTYEDLSCYLTYEPFFYFGSIRTEGEAILIVENKDTFFSLKKLFSEGINSWGRVHFSMLIYGEGNKITKSIDYLEELKVPIDTNIYYFGDLDPVGITIFHRVKESSKREIQLMTMLYREMWKNRKHGTILKKQDWNDQAFDCFISYFNLEERDEYAGYLKENKYIPQEALSIEALRGLSDGIRKTV